MFSPSILSSTRLLLSSSLSSLQSPDLGFPISKRKFPTPGRLKLSPFRSPSQILEVTAAMDKDNSPGGHGLPPFSASRYSPFPSPTSGSFQLKSEASTPSSSATGNSSQSFSHDISKMSDFPPRNTGHRRAHSEVSSLPDDISFDSDLGVVGCNDGPSLSDENEDDIVSLYMDMDKFGSLSASSGGVSGPTGGNASTKSNVSVNASQGALVGISAVEGSGPGSSSERPTRGRHQHSQSMDGSTSFKTELLTSGSDGPSPAEAKKAMSAAKLADLAMVDPKRAKRIWANRQSAARSKERKMRYIAELERKVQTLQTEATTLSAQLTMLQRDTTGLTAENSELKLRLQTMEQQVHLQDALNDALREEVQRLKMMTGQAIPNGGQMLNYGSPSFGTNQFYCQNQNMQSLLATHQLQQLNLHSQQQLHPSQLQQHAPPSEVKIRAPIAPTHNRRDSSSDTNTSPAKE